MERKTCTFFGHKTCPSSIVSALETLLEKLILQEQANTFYVGNQGQFDVHVYYVLQKLKKKYPYIQYSIVLAYLPKKPTTALCAENTVFPERLETVPPRYAIQHRNEWMLQTAEIVICYVEHTWGGAAQFMKKAIKQNKTVYNLCQTKEGGTPKSASNELSEIIPSPES